MLVAYLVAACREQGTQAEISPPAAVLVVDLGTSVGKSSRMSKIGLRAHQQTCGTAAHLEKQLTGTALSFAVCTGRYCSCQAGQWMQEHRVAQ